jgi:hypothetical protein
VLNVEHILLDDIIEIPVQTHETSPITIDVRDNVKSLTSEYIILESDNDDSTDENCSDSTNAAFFIDRSSTHADGSLKSRSTSNEDYVQEDSKYAQLPTRTSSNHTVIRPIISKHQRRKKSHTTSLATTGVSSTPLVSAIDRIIDQMDQPDKNDLAKSTNCMTKVIKKRKKKKKKTKSIETIVVH